MRDIRSHLATFRRPLVAALLVAVTAGVHATTRGPDAGGYTATDETVYSFVDITGAGGGAQLLAGVDDGTAMLSLPFPFTFYGQAYNQVCVSANGALYFVTGDAACLGFNDFANVDLSVVTPPNDAPSVLPLWTDLTFQVAGAGAVYYRSVGTSPDRSFVVQWHNAFPQGSPNPVTFQVVLSEGSNAIRAQYRTVNLGSSNPASNGGLATIGIRNAQSLANQQQIAWSYASPVIGDNVAILFSRGSTVKPGDVDGDGVITCNDLTLIRQALKRVKGEQNYNPAADVNSDGIINGTDVSAVLQILGKAQNCAD